MGTSRLRLSAYLAGYVKAESLSHSHFPPLFISTSTHAYIYYFFCVL